MVVFIMLYVQFVNHVFKNFYIKIKVSMSFHAFSLWLRMNALAAVFLKAGPGTLGVPKTSLGSGSSHYLIINLRHYLPFSLLISHACTVELLSIYVTCYGSRLNAEADVKIQLPFIKLFIKQICKCVKQRHSSY